MDHLAHCGLFRSGCAHRRRLGRGDEASRTGGLHLLRIAATHGHRHGAVLAQQGRQRLEVDGRLCIAHLYQVNQHGIVVEQLRITAEALGKLARQLLGICRPQRKCDHRQLGAFHIKTAALRRFT
ncbi:hypothetical protein D3C72_1725920 [compost metagenome]